MDEGEEGLETLCGRALRAGCQNACRLGLEGEDAEDCALGFVQHVLGWYHRADHPTRERAASDAWLNCSAANWTRNVLRARRRRLRREVSLSEPALGLMASFYVHGGSVSAPLFQQELLARICLPLAQLSPMQSALLLTNLDATVSPIRTTVFATPNAQRQALWRVRRKFCSLLTESGLCEEEAREYLPLLLVPVLPWQPPP